MCIEAIEAVIAQSEQVGPRYQLLWVIAWHINRDTGDWPLSVEEMTREGRMSRRQIYYHLARLEASGELIITRRTGRRNLYSLSYFPGSIHELSTRGAEIRTGADFDGCGNPHPTGAEIRTGRGADLRPPVLYTGKIPKGPDGRPSSPDVLPENLPYGGYAAWLAEQQRGKRLVH